METICCSFRKEPFRPARPRFLRKRPYTITATSRCWTVRQRPKQHGSANLLLEMSYADPEVRRLLDLEGLKQWVPGRTEGYALLARAVDRFRYLEPFVEAVSRQCA